MQKLTLKSLRMNDVFTVIVNLKPEDVIAIVPTDSYKVIREKDKIADAIEAANHAIKEAKEAIELVVKPIVARFNEEGKNLPEEEKGAKYAEYEKEVNEKVKAKEDELGMTALAEADITVELSDSRFELLKDLFKSNQVAKMFKQSKPYNEVMDALGIE
jgi:hypothetical protein